MRDTLRQALVVIFAVAEIGTSLTLGSSLDQGTDPTPVYFLPFGPTFIIWAFIYSGALAYGVYQALPGQRERALHRRIGGWLALNYALTSLWNLTAGQAGTQGTPDFQPLYVVATVGILAGMLLATTQAVIAFREMDEQLTPRDRWLAQVPATLFFAWLNVAAVANTTAALDALGYTGEPNGGVWAAAMLVVATALATLMIRYSRAGIGTVTYSAVIVWAVFGILANNLERSPLVATTSVISAAVVLAVTAWHLIRPQTNRPRIKAAL